jgi:uncharacterized membrane protein
LTAASGELARQGRVWPSPRNIVLLVTTTFGLGISIYLTLTHYARGVVSLVCSNNGAINCEKVTTSPQSMVFGIPVAVLGLAFFVPMLILSLPRVWQLADRRIAIVRLAMSVIGMGFVLYLLHAELFEIHAICLWCSGVHVLTFIVFCTVVTGWYEATTPPEDFD